MFKRYAACVGAAAVMSLSGLVTAAASAAAVDDSTSTTVDTPVTYNVSANDTNDCADGTGYLGPNYFFTGPQQATQVVTTQQGTWDATDGSSITYTPAPGFSGTASQVYWVDCYGQMEDYQESYSAVFTVDVGPSAEIPIVSAPVAGAAAALAALIGGVWLVRRRAVA